MKTKLIALVLAGMMVLSLVGCGEQKDPTGNTDANNGGVSDDAAGSDVEPKIRSAVPGNQKGRTWETDVRSGNRDYDFDNNYGSTFGGIDQDNTVYDGMGTYRADRTATWQQMLENGRVHDRDGFLLDGENTTW